MFTINLNNTQHKILRNLNRVNILLGKNGCGKSTLLKDVDENPSAIQNIGKMRYITPERGGSLIFEAGIEQSYINDANWLTNTRRKNQLTNFRQQSVAQYRELENSVLREIEKNKEIRANLDFTFDTYITEINALLDNVQIERQKGKFRIKHKISSNEIDSGSISSGESELISLAIECLMFNRECEKGKINLVLMDEPDVHLHPDLQYRFTTFLNGLIDKNPDLNILIATHSTAFLSGFSQRSDATYEFMTSQQKDFSFKPLTNLFKTIIPIFSIHPLSNIFNQDPVLLVEGEDDERIWRQVLRSSSGRFHFFPCEVGGKSEFETYEVELQAILNSVYDKPKAFSLRDGDGIGDEIDDRPPINRFRLKCYSAENLLLSDEALKAMGFEWNQLESLIISWLSNHSSHPHFSFIEKFKNNGFNRRSEDLKEIRNDLLGIMACAKPWEIIVGKTISTLSKQTADYSNPNSIYSFLGKKLVDGIL